MKDKTSMGYFISVRRKLIGLTQEKLAQKIGVSKSAVAKWETGRGLPDRENLRRLSEAVHVPVDDLHRMIEKEDAAGINRTLNITPEVIAALEAYGYKVLKPEDESIREQKYICKKEGI